MTVENKNALDPRHVDVMDGIRAISIILVLIFHFWQQTWISPVIRTPFLSSIGLPQIDLTYLARTGYLFVDMMVLISGFLLFLPLMRHILLGESMIKWKDYARKRVARILPSYLFCVLVLFFAVNLPNHVYPTAERAIRDLVTHLTFTHMFFTDTYLATQLNGVLWTLGVEVWFYVLFPLFAEMLKRREPADAGKKSTAASIAGMAALAAVFFAITYAWKQGKILKPGAHMSMLINQLPAFMGTYAVGMIGAFIYVLICKHAERTAGLRAAATLLTIVSICFIIYMLKDCAKYRGEKAQTWQTTERTKLTISYMVFIISAALSANWFRFLLSNRLMRFLASISYNLYIWHQWIAVFFKNTLRIPYWEGTTPPNQLGDRIWMDKYAIIITLAAFAAAILTTYLIEKPFANLILGKPMFGTKGKKNKDRGAEKAA